MSDPTSSTTSLGSMSPATQTCSAASSVNPPLKTASRLNIRCSRWASSR